MQDFLRAPLGRRSTPSLPKITDPVLSCFTCNMQLANTQNKPDILVTERGGQPVLAVEVKRHAFDDAARQQIAAYSEAVGAEFVMGIDPRQIVVAPTREGVPDWGRAIQLSTVDILQHYSNFPNIDQIEGFYLESLVEAWLQDFALSWKSERPPGHNDLEKIGLALRLRNSETHSES
jgi:hypothetical protein